MQITPSVRLRLKALIPAAGILFGAIADPRVTGLLPDSWAHVIVGISAFIAIFTPAVATNRPPSEK